MDNPASVTRKEAMVSGGRYRSPIFAAMKLTAHTTTTSAIEAAIITRLGARPAEVSTYTDSGQPFFAHVKLMDALIQANRRLQFLLQFRMNVQIGPAQRPLDHHQVISVQLLEQRPIRSAIRRIRIYHQPDIGKILPQPLHLLHILARFDLDLD